VSAISTPAHNYTHTCRDLSHWTQFHAAFHTDLMLNDIISYTSCIVRARYHPTRRFLNSFSQVTWTHLLKRTRSPTYRALHHTTRCNVNTLRKLLTALWLSTTLSSNTYDRHISSASDHRVACGYLSTRTLGRDDPTHSAWASMLVLRALCDRSTWECTVALMWRGASACRGETRLEARRLKSSPQERRASLDAADKMSRATKPVSPLALIGSVISTQ